MPNFMLVSSFALFPYYFEVTRSTTSVAAVAAETAAGFDSTGTRQGGGREHWRDTLYESVDGKGLRRAGSTPISFLGHGRHDPDAGRQLREGAKDSGQSYADTCPPG